MADGREMSELTGAEFSPGGALRGQTLGPFLLVERLGGGAMATVYRAVDQRTGRAVAIKVLRPDADAIMRERFRREAETHSNLNHPNIVQILDVGQAPESGSTYIAMELVDGPNLSEVMEEVVRLSPADAAAYPGTHRRRTRLRLPPGGDPPRRQALQRAAAQGARRHA